MYRRAKIGYPRHPLHYKGVTLFPTQAKKLTPDDAEISLRNDFRSVFFSDFLYATADKHRQF